MAKVVVLTMILVGLAIVLLGVKVLFVKGGKFPSGHVHDLPARQAQALKRRRQKADKTNE